MTAKRKTSALAQLPGELLLALHACMLRIRRAEETLADVFSAGEIPGFLHVCLGQEAAPAGVCAHLEPDDYLGTTHRGHGHALAKGVELHPFLAELLGRADGYCRGRSGSMHLADAGHGLLGANGIVGGGIPIATGAALAAQLLNPGRVAVCCFGDGASSQGTFHESLNIAALWKLPVVYVCENNGWAEFTPQSTHMTMESIAERARACGVPAETVPNDVVEIYQAAGRAIARARSGEGPSLLEVKSSRWHGHFVGDAQKYRQKQAVQEAMAQDCLADFQQKLLREKLLTPRTLEEADSLIRQEIAQALEAARQSPRPEPEDLLTDLYA